MVLIKLHCFKGFRIYYCKSPLHISATCADCASAPLPEQWKSLRAESAIHKHRSMQTECSPSPQVVLNMSYHQEGEIAASYHVRLVELVKFGNVNIFSGIKSKILFDMQYTTEIHK